MKFIEKVFLKRSLHRMNVALETGGDIVVLLFEHEDKLLFIQGSIISNQIFPLMLDVELMGMIEEDLIKIKAYCEKVFRFTPSEILISPKYQSLQPFYKSTIYLAKCILKKEEYKGLQGLFVEFTRSEILLKRQSNLLFEIISRELTS